MDHNQHFNLLATWDHPIETIQKILSLAEKLQKKQILRKYFSSGLAIALFRDHSTRTRYSFHAAANLLGLSVQEIEEGKTQAAHGESIQETFTMLSFLTRAIGIRDDIYLEKGHTFMTEVAQAVKQSYDTGVLRYHPTVINLQSDRDHPTQSLSDLLHLIQFFGGIKNLRGKRLVMSWAYSPTYGKPLSVPQGVIGLMTRFGMNVTLAYPPEYSLIDDIETLAHSFAKDSGGSFHVMHTMKDAFKDADIVYPKSWAPFSIMKQRTKLLSQGKVTDLKNLEKECLAMNQHFSDWTCSEKLMKITNRALYLHCLPADISGVTCQQGEVEASVFDRFRPLLYKQASFKPFIIAATILLSQREHSKLHV